jgi:hypothetical protein
MMPFLMGGIQRIENLTGVFDGFFERQRRQTVMRLSAA